MATAPSSERVYSGYTTMALRVDKPAVTQLDGWKTPGYDIPGAAKKVDSLAACQNLCRDDDRCRAYDYQKKEQICYPKADAPRNLAPEANVVSGVKLNPPRHLKTYCASPSDQPNSFRWSNAEFTPGYRAYQGAYNEKANFQWEASQGIKSESEAAQKCNNDPECVGFVQYDKTAFYLQHGSSTPAEFASNPKAIQYQRETDPSMANKSQLCAVYIE